jgi:hypothetical protein
LDDDGQVKVPENWAAKGFFSASNDGGAFDGVAKTKMLD